MDVIGFSSIESYWGMIDIWLARAAVLIHYFRTLEMCINGHFLLRWQIDCYWIECKIGNNEEIKGHHVIVEDHQNYNR